VLPREGPPVQVLVIAPPGQRAAFEQALVSDARLSFLTVDQDEAARRVGLAGAPAETGAERLYLHLAVRRAPKEQFARREDRRSFHLWQLQRGLVAAGALGFAACALVALAGWYEAAGMRDDTQRLRAEAQAAQQEYQRITSAFPVTQTTTDNLRATVVEFGSIAKRSPAPEGAMLYVSRAMGAFPQIELDSLQWRVERPGERRGERTAKPAAASASGELAQVLELSGRVGAMRRSEYRAITAEVQRFVDALRADPAYRVVRVELPFDITSEGTLSGDIGAAAETGEAPRFVIVLARSLQ